VQRATATRPCCHNWPRAAGDLLDIKHICAAKNSQVGYPMGAFEEFQKIRLGNFPQPLLMLDEAA
jgi:hypothetical protein